MFGNARIRRLADCSEIVRRSCAVGTAASCRRSAARDWWADALRGEPFEGSDPCIVEPETRLCREGRGRKVRSTDINDAMVEKRNALVVAGMLNRGSATAER
jgi:hypothetical protein